MTDSEYARLVAMAKRYARGLGVHYRELISAGWEGWERARKRFDGSHARRATLQTFAEHRAYGAMIDYARDATGHRRRKRLTREPFYLEDLTAREVLPAADTRDEIAHALRSLSPRQREALTLRFARGLSLLEIGARWGVSKSRVCQVVAGARRKVVA